VEDPVGSDKLKKPLVNIPKYIYTSCWVHKVLEVFKEMLTVAKINYFRPEVLDAEMEDFN
jgi:hypothetical protein